MSERRWRCRNKTHRWKQRTGAAVLGSGQAAGVKLSALTLRRNVPTERGSPRLAGPNLKTEPSTHC